jgi:hypothetical protein
MMWNFVGKAPYQTVQGEVYMPGSPGMWRWPNPNRKYPWATVLPHHQAGESEKEDGARRRPNRCVAGPDHRFESSRKNG